MGTHMNISTIDLTIIIIYLVGIVGIGCGAGWWQKRKLRNSVGAAEAEGGYFLAGGTLTWPVIGLALFSTNISTIHLVSLAEEGYKNGLVYGNTEWMAGFCLIILALFFAPFYLKAKVTTLPDFLEKRYSRGSRNWLAVLSIVSAVFIHIGFTLYTAAAIMKGMFGMNLYTCIILIAVLTGIYTIVGGLLAVVMTETIQTVVLLVGAICLTVICLMKVGGWEGLVETIEPIKLSMLRSGSEPNGGMPWYAALLGYPVIGIWYWCTDQTIVQRVLGAKDENHARVGPLFAGFIKLLPVFILVLPGLICFALVKQGKIAAPESTSEVYSVMIRELLPTGLIGIMAAALLAAAMSTISGALNSIATLFSYDLYKQWKPKADDKHLIRVGRIVTFIGMILAIAWSIYGIQAKGAQTIFQQFSTIICFMAPPITATFLLGVFWKKASSFGSLFTLISGSILGFMGYVLLVHNARLEFLSQIWEFKMVKFLFGNFWMAGFYLAIICGIIHIISSLIKPNKLTEEQQSLVWGNPLDALKGEAWKGIGNYKFLSIGLFVALVIMYIIFR